MKNFLKIGGIIAIIALISVVALGVLVAAQGPDGEAQQFFRGKMGGMFGGWMGDIDHEEAMQKALEDGKITPEQAELMNEHWQSMQDGDYSGFGGRGMMSSDMPYAHGKMMGGAYPHDDGWMMDSAGHDEAHAAMAAALGLSVEELDAAMAEGKTMTEIAAEHGVDVETLWATMDAARQEALQQAVEDGSITQEQADFMNERMQNMGDHDMSYHEFGGEDGDSAPRGRMHGGMRGNGQRW